MKEKEKVTVRNYYADGREMNIKKVTIPNGHPFYAAYVRMAKETILKER